MDGSLSPDSFRDRLMLVTAASGQKATLRQLIRSPHRRSQSELHHEPECLGRLEADHQLEFDHKLDA
jgi:hypothetical protein